MTAQVAFNTQRNADIQKLAAEGANTQFQAQDRQNQYETTLAQLNVAKAAQQSAKCWHSTRRGYWYAPKYALGRPVDQVNDQLLAMRLPLKLRQWIFRRTMQLTVGDLTRFGLPKPDQMHQDKAFAEQDLGEWQGMNRAAFFAARPASIASYWFAPAHERAPGGESFNDLSDRTVAGIRRINTAHAGKDIVCVSHGGPIKAALVHMAKGLARQYAAKKIRVNVVSPGTVYFKGGVWNLVEQNMPKRYQDTLARNPTGRMATPQEIANAAVFLASPASSFTTGSNLIVDGAISNRVNF